MTKIKKVLAALLALLMIFSSVSVMAFADDSTVNGTTVTFATKFFKQVDGSWVETTRAKPGETVKARVYLGTDYFSNSSDLLFFYDKGFFTHSYGEYNELEVNREEGSFAKVNGASGYFMTDANIDLSDLAAKGYVDSDFLASHGAFAVSLMLGVDNNVKYSADTWLFEFTLKVADDATGEGDLFVVENTVKTAGTREDAHIDVPRGEADGGLFNIESMALWTPTVVISSQPVSVMSTLVFKAEDATTVTGQTEFSGVIGTAVTAPTVEKTGYTFVGWKNESGEIVAAPTEIPAENLTLTAEWVKNVTVTFDTDGGSTIDPAPYTDKTPGTELVAPADPTKEGYTFLGWMDASGNVVEIPNVFPTSDVTYTAKWALNVKMNFIVDGEVKQSFDGYAGQEFDTSKVNEPSKTGYYFIGWSSSVPSSFPEATTDYVAQWDTYTYEVRYYVDGAFVATNRVPYGSVIKTDVPGASAPVGYELTGWFTDPDCTVPFVEGTVMSAANLKLYAKTKVKTYTSTFNAAGGKFADGKEETTVDTDYGEAIIAPAAPTLEGYTFAGWTPDVGFMDENGGKTYYATWVANDYNVVYYVDGEVYDTLDIAFGEKLEVPSEPGRTGRTFIGWTDTEGSDTIVDPTTFVMNESGYKFYAVFSDNTYNAIFYLTQADKDNGVVFKTVPTVYGQQIAAPEATARAGYTFLAWSPAPGAMPANDLEFVGTWKANTYTIKFFIDADAAEALETVTADFGETIAAPKTPSKEGYTFVEWSPEVPETMPVVEGEFLRINATWKVNEYTIAFDSDGGTPVSPITQDYGTAVTAPAAPTKTGYDFVGWFADGADEAYVFTTMPAIDNETATLTLTARWTAKSYDPKDGLGVKFNANGGAFADGETEKLVAATFNEAITAPEGDPVRSGYDFLGWSKNSGATIPAELGTLTQEITADSTVVFYAVWKVETYPAENGITFNADGGAFVDGETVKRVAATYGEAIAAPAAPTRTGYTFEGWASESGAQTGSHDLGNLTVDLDETTLTYYAAWKAISYSENNGVKFDANTGAFANGMTTVRVAATFDQPIVAPAEEPIKAGHTFKGWAATSTATEPLESLGNLTQVIDPDAPLTFYAVWEKETYIGKITFNANNGAFDDGETVKAIDITFGDAIVAPGVPTRTGYVFKGWATSAGALAGSTDLGNLTTDLSDTSITYYAVWAEADGVEYTVKVYIMNTEGVYGDPEVKVTTGKTGDAVSADKFYTLTDGLVLDSAYADEARTGVIAADGSTVLEVHIKRNTYTFSVIVDGVLTKNDYYFGAIVAEPETPSKVGYTFTGWDGTVPATMPANDVTVTATWKINQYTITFDTDGGTVIAPITQDYNTAVARPADPTKTGYTFAGWDKTIPENMPAENITVKALWTINQYTITFDTDGGRDVPAITQDYGTDVAAPADPTKTGYTFAGWDKAIPATMPAENVTITAKWNVNQYTITFDTDGGNSIAPITQDFGTDVVAPADPTKTGYTFAGWDREIPSTMPAESITVKAQWKINQYTITFDTDGGTAIDPITQDYNTAVVAPADPTKEGYTFAGWDATIPATMPAKDTVIKAKWTVNKYTITFDVDGGSYVAPITQNYGTEIVAPADPTKTGYTFAGWDTEIPSTMPAGDMTIKAKWTVNQYTITVDTDGGTAIAPITQDYGTDVVAPAAPTKTGYTFAGWSEAFPSTMPAGDMTIKALWTVKTFDPEVNGKGVKFNANGGAFADGSTETLVKATFGEAIAAPAAPVRAGYTFAGWAATAESKVALADLGTLDVDLDDGEVIFYAVWTEADGVNYSVEIYVQATDGSYALSKTETASGKTGSAVTVEGFYTVEEGFEHNAAHEGAVESGVIAADGSTVLKVYIARKTYSASFEGVEEPVKALYGAPIAAPAAPAVPGKTFIKWVDADGNEPSTMPIGGASFTAVYETLTYNVKYYVDGEFKGSYRLSSGTAIPTSYIGYEVPEGYEFSGWFTDSAMTIALADGAVVEAADVSLYGKTTAKIVNVVFSAGEGAFADGATEKTVPTAFGDLIVAPADDQLVREGYKFVGWDREVGYLDTMTPATYVATWEAIADKYTVTFISNGEEYEKFTMAVGEVIDFPADPYLEGATFDGWYDDNGVRLVEGAIMPAADVVYTARFVTTGYTVRFYQYEASEHGPAGVENPQFIDYTYTAGVKYGDEIVLPATPTTVNTNHYTFLGWFDADGNKYEAGATMPALADGETELKLYPRYERITVKLVPADGTTTVIERYTTGKVIVKEQLADNTVTDTVYQPATAGDYSRWFIYGLPGSRLSGTNIKNGKYFTVKGDGRFVITPVNGNGYGTGALVQVYDCATGEDVLVEQFYIVYFGDLDGDAKVTSFDLTLAKTEIGKKVWSSSRKGIPYMVKAADLDGDTKFTSFDLSVLIAVIGKTKKIDQVTGIAS